MEGRGLCRRSERAAPIDIDVGGLTLDLSGGSRRTRDACRDVDGVDLTLARVAVREAAAPTTPLASLDQVAVEGGRVDLQARQVTASRVSVTGGGTAVVRAADGSFPLMAKLGPADRGKPARPATPSPTSPRPVPGPKPWTVAVEKLDLVDHRLAITDQSVTPAVAMQIEGIKVNARGLRTDGNKPIAFDTSFRVAKAGASRQGSSRRTADRPSQADALPAALTRQPSTRQERGRRAALGEGHHGRLTYRRGADRAVVTYTGAADVDRV